MAPGVEQSIVIVRGERVLLDVQLAALYGVPTKALNQAVKRNAARFPADFRFQLTRAERDEVVTNRDHLGRMKFSAVMPWAFTEHGAVMAANVLNSGRAVAASIEVVRAFVRLRRVTAQHAELVRLIEELDHKFTGTTQRHENKINQIYEILDAMIEPPEPAKKSRIGFRPPEEP